MMRIFQILFLFLGYSLFLLHDFVPHHHHDIGSVAYSDKTQKDHHDNTGQEEGHHFPIPAHHHLSADESFGIVRTSSWIKILRAPAFDPDYYACSDIFRLQEPDVSTRVSYFTLAPPNYSGILLLPSNCFRGSPLT